MKLSEGVRKGVGEGDINKSTHHSLLNTKFELSSMEMYHFPKNLYPIRLADYKRKQTVADLIWRLHREEGMSMKAVAMWIETLESYLLKQENKCTL